MWGTKRNCHQKQRLQSVFIHQNKVFLRQFLWSWCLNWKAIKCLQQFQTYKILFCTGTGATIMSLLINRLMRWKKSRRKAQQDHQYSPPTNTFVSTVHQFSITIHNLSLPLNKAFFVPRLKPACPTWHLVHMERHSTVWCRKVHTMEGRFILAVQLQDPLDVALQTSLPFCTYLLSASE